MSTGSAGAYPWVLTDVSLVVKKHDLDPDVITERLGLHPSEAWAPGVDRWNPGGDTDGVWLLQHDEHVARDFSVQLDATLRAAEGCAPVLDALKAEGYKVMLAVYGFTDHDGQLSFSADDMARIARLKIPLRLVPNLNAR
ncbi:DUF4279 domain-containing protein [Streptomyces liangshanensis]|uniref:DUF4279 domain-containing protein n=1 Tax=Streptomyces liangshanensis TaxID=2717324 RepID=UPI0036D96DD2